MSKLKGVIYLFFSLCLVGCLDELPELGSDGFCPGSRLSDGECSVSYSLEEESWNFTSASNYTYDSNYIEFNSGTASLKQVDQLYSGTDFSSGTYRGSSLDSNNNLTIDLSSEITLSSSWTPQYSSLLGYWKMDGDWTDSSGKGNHGTGQAGVTYSTFSRIGSHAGYFDGGNDRVVAGASNKYLATANQPFSIIVWASPSSISGSNIGGRVFSLHRGASDGSALALGFGGTDKIQFYNHDDGSYVDWEATAELNKWQHIALTYNGTCFQKYINGRKDGSCLTKGLVAGGSYELHIGSYNSGGSVFSGKLDDLSMWSTGLSATEISVIYNRQKQKYAAQYDSPVINLGASANWTGLKAVTTLPFMKDVASTSENSSDYSSLTGDLSSGLVALWNLNEASGTSGAGSVKDMSGNNHHATPTNVSFGHVGKKGNAGYFDGSTSRISTDDTYPIGTSLTLSSWVYLESIPGGWTTILEHARETSQWGGLWKRSGGNTFHFRWGNSGSRLAHFSTTIESKKWYHVVGTHDDATDTTTLYLNGVVDRVLTGVPSPSAIAGKTFVGSKENGGENFPGLIDETAIWSRALTNSEVVELYRRGANRLKYQVRSCDDSTCSSDEWIGPNGDGTSYFSELFNNNSIDGSGNPTGDVITTSPDFTFSDFVTAPSDKRYFQYRVFMESEDENTLCSGSPCMPELTSVEITPGSRYYGGAPTIITKNPISYSYIKDITFEDSGTCQVEYQLSNDGVSYYYWNGSSWTSVSSDSNRNNSSTISTNISKFSLQVGVGDLYVKSFLSSDMSQSCGLESITVNKW